MPENRDNVQVAQPHVEGYGTADKQGWPEPLVDPSSKLRVKVTNGSNGSQSFIAATSTSRQKELSLAEGSSNIKTGNQEDQGGHGNKLKTSQQNAGDIQQSESEGD